jgi:hypothetical protein
VLFSRILVAALATAALTSPSLAEKTVSEEVLVPASLHMEVGASGCTNRGGPEITLSGDFLTGALAGRLTARNAGGVHEDSVEAVLAAHLVPDAGFPLTIPKQPPEKFDGGGAGGNPHIFFQALDGYGKAIHEPIHLGRCVQGLDDIHVLFGVLSEAEATIDGSCSNNPGPYITIDGALILGGVRGKIIFANNDKMTHRRDELGSLHFEIVPRDMPVVFPKQPSIGGVTGNPLLYFQYTGRDGEAVSDEIRLGRCKKL